ncbi:MAG TPA: EI24 domain-containing protein [Aestuariivirga sp.]|nr:EI24 domain-containing protein [Aestuariivirga sp.]
MISAALKALRDLLSPEFRSVLFKAIGLTIGLFITVLVAVEILLSTLTLLPWPWADTMLAVGTGVALFVAFFFLMAPVTAIFAGFFLDNIAERVERLHYPRDVPGKPLGAALAVLTALQFALVVLVVNLAILPAVFLAFGAVVLVAANAYLIAREYFEMIAMRHMPVAEARALRKENTPAVFAAGFIPAVLALVPFINLAVPLFATAYFVHIFKKVAASSA